MPSANEIRQQFIDFFVKKHGHTFVPSSPVVPQDDPTLLFTNAGMNQFKPVFLGLEKPPYVRAANTQKCIRAGGKHNDLDDVGKDTYHHTFFEMLGNWSFGDYFKKEAIAWAWELLTDVWKMDPQRLHVTVFGGDKNENLEPDEEARQFWISEAGVDPSHIHYGSKKDNFWEMGNTGPCGPCTEIHYDRTPNKSGAKLVNAGSPDVIEIWNLVFIQFNRGEDGKLTPLPAKHVDTGMGFERVTAVLQGMAKNDLTLSNYDTDVFTPIFEAIQKVSKAPKYTGRLDDLRDMAYRTIADHIRTLTFALADGAAIGNLGRDYVLRRILRRAERYGWEYLGVKDPFLSELVPTVVATMRAAYPELATSAQRVSRNILDEEKGFLRTLERGMAVFNKERHTVGELWDAARQFRPGVHPEEAFTPEERAYYYKYPPSNYKFPVISGTVAFELHDTHGLYIDIVEQKAAETGAIVDRQEFEKLMEQAKLKSRGAKEKLTVGAIKGDLPKTDDSPKYGPLTLRTKVVGWVKDNTVFREGSLRATETVALLLDCTNFYAEQGGQVGDIGRITAEGMNFVVDDTQRLGDSVLHSGVLTDGTVKVGQDVTATVTDRSNTTRNHTATHLLNLALREVLGTHVEQKGSLVDAEKTRFDFSHDKPLTADEIRRVEEIVNAHILRDEPVTPVTMPLAEAKKLPGVRAVFGEKYPDPVRVIMIGAEKLGEVNAQMSVEFCGGTHLSRTSQAGLFKIVGQSNVAKGVRRVVGVTGQRAFEHNQKLSDILNQLIDLMNSPVAEDLPKLTSALQEEVKKLKKEVQKGAATDLNGAANQLLAKATEVKGAKLVVGELPGAPIESMRGQIDRLRQKAGSSLIVFGWKNEDGTAGLAVGVSEDLVKKGIKSNDIIKPVAEIIGGKGGGPPHLATAGGKDAGKLPEALAKALELGKAILDR